MKAFSIFMFAVVLAGCQAFEPGAPVEPVPPVAREATPEDAAASWLLKRQQLCSLEADERRQRLREAAGDDDARRDRLLLASCEPERTPGLLREALQGVPEQTDPALQALLEMIHDHARSYRVLEEQNAQLAAQLESTIEGIRRIEADMDHLRRSRRSP